jgi:hypothetical protein
VNGRIRYPRRLLGLVCLCSVALLLILRARILIRGIDAGNREESVRVTSVTAKPIRNERTPAHYAVKALPMGRRFLDPDQLTTYTVNGHVVDEIGNAVPDARLTFNLSGSSPVEQTSFTAITDSDGRFHLDPPEPVTSFTSCEIIAEADGLTKTFPGECRIGLPVLHDSETSITLYAPVGFSGRVVDELTSVGLSDSRVIVCNQITRNRKHSFGNDGQDIFVTTTSADGVFHFSGLRPGFITLLAQHPEFALAYKSLVQVPGTTTVVSLNHGGTVSGTIIDGTAPIAGATIELAGIRINRRQFGGARGVTNASGDFEFQNLPYGIFDRKHEYMAEVQTTAAIFPKYAFCLSEQLPEREFVFQPSDMDLATTEGEDRIVWLDKTEIRGIPKLFPDAEQWPADSTGSAVIRGTVRLQKPEMLPRMQVSLRYTTYTKSQDLDTSATFEFSGLVAGDYRVSCSMRDDSDYKQGRPLLPKLKVTIKTGEHRDVEFIEEAGALSGRLDGITSGVKYNISLAADETSSPFHGHGGIAGSEVQEDGRFVVGGLPAGRHVISVMSVTEDFPSKVPSGCFFAAGPVSFTSDGKTTHEMTLHIREHDLRGRLVDAESGAPIENGKVQLYSRVDWRLGSGAWYKEETDEHGDFTIPIVPEGTFRLTIDPGKDYVTDHRVVNMRGKAQNLGEIAVQKYRSGILIRTNGDSGLNEMPERLTCIVWPVDANSQEIYAWDFGQSKQSRVQDNAYLLRPIAAGMYNMLILPPVFARGKQCFAATAVPNILVGGNRITELSFDYIAGNHVELACVPGENIDELGDGQFWVQDPTGCIWPIWVSNNFSLDTWLQPGEYIFGLTTASGSKKSVGFTVQPGEGEKQLVQLRL